VKSRYENWQLPLYWLDTGMKYTPVVPVKSSFFRLCSCAGIAPTARSVGCPCPVCVVCCQCSAQGRIPSSGKELILCSARCWTPIAAGAPRLAGVCPGRLWLPASLSPLLGQGLSPGPLGFSKNVEYFSPAAAEQDMLSAGINWLSLTWPPRSHLLPSQQTLVFSEE